MKRTNVMWAVLAVTCALAVVALVGRRRANATSPKVESAAEVPAGVVEPAATSPVFVTNAGAGAAMAYPVPPPQQPGEISATEHASLLREELCACETRACIDAVNARSVRTMGTIAASTYDETSRAEMRAANACVRSLLSRLAADGGP
jgi:hypothetical protein